MNCCNGSAQSITCMEFVQLERLPAKILGKCRLLSLHKSYARTCLQRKMTWAWRHTLSQPTCLLSKQSSFKQCSTDARLVSDPNAAKSGMMHLQCSGQTSKCLASSSLPLLVSVLIFSCTQEQLPIAFKRASAKTVASSLTLNLTSMHPIWSQLMVNFKESAVKGTVTLHVAIQAYKSKTRFLVLPLVPDIDAILGDP